MHFSHSFERTILWDKFRLETCQFSALASPFSGHTFLWKFWIAAIFSTAKKAETTVPVKQSNLCNGLYAFSLKRQVRIAPTLQRRVSKHSILCKNCQLEEGKTFSQGDTNQTFDILHNIANHKKIIQTNCKWILVTDRAGNLKLVQLPPPPAPDRIALLLNCRKV